MKTPIIVTGGAGYVGSHACKALARAGLLPVTYDNMSSGHEWAVKWGPLELGDLHDRNRLDQVFRKYEPVSVMHFAAFAYVDESVANPGKYYQNNVVGTLTLLESMRDNGVTNIVFSSSCATYGIPDAVPITEATNQRPINPYGASKLMVERMLVDFELAHQISWVALRYFNAAGADLEHEIGEQHEPETHLIPVVLDAACGRRTEAVIFGTDHDTPDGSCIRDYIHVCDLADAHILALQSINSGMPSAAYNLGNGRGFSVKEVIDAVKRVTGMIPSVTLGDRRAGDPPVLISDSRKAREVLSWQPQITDLDEIIGSAWKWHQATQSLRRLT